MKPALPRYKAARRAGFTLTELLAVMVVLGVVTMLALPAFQQARASSQAAICLGNLRSVGNIVLLYAAENNQNLVPTLAGDLPWSAWLDETGYLRKVSWDGVEKSIMRCPEREKPPAITGGSSKLHYAMSTYPGFTNTYTVRKPQLRKITAIRKPAETFLLGETEAWYSLSKVASNAVYPHRRGMNLFFADGHCERYQGDLSKTTSTAPYPFH